MVNRDRAGPDCVWHAFVAPHESVDDLSPDKEPACGSTVAGSRQGRLSPAGHGVESTIRYLGVEVDDALEIAEQTDV